MASDALFLALSQALSQPSKSFRAVQAGGQAGQDILGGYAQGLGIRRAREEYPLEIAGKKSALYDHYAKLAEQVGPDRATELMGSVFKGAGLDMPQSQSSSTSYTPEQLTTMGPFGKTRLEAQKTAQAIGNEAPYDYGQVQGMLSQNPDIASALIRANPGGKIPYRQVQAAISALKPNMIGGFYQGRLANMQLSQLPSQLGPNTAAGAAYQVKVASRQGKSLIAKATSPQNLALASVDLSRAVQRAAPISETIGAGNYAQSLPTLFGQLQQKITADPNSPDVPKLRKQLYDTFDELDKAATPWIASHLQNMEANGTNSSFGGNWNGTKQREMGMDIPDVPFDIGGSSQNPNISTGVPTVGGIFQGGKVLHVQKL